MIEPIMVRTTIRMTAVLSPPLKSIELITDFYERCYVTRLKSMGEDDDFCWMIGVTK